MAELALALAQTNLGETTYYSSSALLKLNNAATKEIPMKLDCDSKKTSQYFVKINRYGN